MVHVDAGWNSELAVANIEKLIKYTGFDLHTEVIDWQDIRKLQVAYLRSGVSNQDVPQDHIFFSSLYHYAIKHKIRYSIGGGNLATESILPKEWHGSAMDAENLLDIYKKNGSGKLNNYKTISFFQYYFYFPFFHRLETFRPLNYMPYDKNKAKVELEKSVLKHMMENTESLFLQNFFRNIIFLKSLILIKEKLTYLV